MNFRKRLVLILFGMLLVFSSYSQNNLLQVERNVSEYFVDTLYTQIDFCYSNSSDSIFILWFDRDNIDSLPNHQKIRKHFHTMVGDMTFMQMILDGNVASFVPGLFNSFMKVIKPKEQFIVSIIRKGEVKANTDLIMSIEKQIVIVNANEIRGLQIDNNMDMFIYHTKSVSILSEWLK
jgi:hypothetical protein